MSSVQCSGILCSVLQNREARLEDFCGSGLPPPSWGLIDKVFWLEPGFFCLVGWFVGLVWLFVGWFAFH